MLTRQLLPKHYRFAAVKGGGGGGGGVRQRLQQQKAWLAQAAAAPRLSVVVGGNNDSLSSSATTTSTSRFTKGGMHFPSPPPASIPPDVQQLLQDLELGATWNHAAGAVAKDQGSAENHLTLSNESDSSNSSSSTVSPTTTTKPSAKYRLWDPEFCRSVVERYESYLLLQQQQDSVGSSIDSTTLAAPSPPAILLSPTVVIAALKCLLKCHFATPAELAAKVRLWERSWGQYQQTPLTDHVTLRLLTANGKAGNVGRCLSLLQLRTQYQYPPRRREFQVAIQSLQVAQWPRHTTTTAVATNNKLEDPTRWLDAILINMKQRGVALDIDLANQMLQCYTITRTNHAVHHFYRVIRSKRSAPSSPLSTSLMVSSNTDETNREKAKMTLYDSDDDDELDQDNDHREVEEWIEDDDDEMEIWNEETAATSSSHSTNKHDTYDDDKPKIQLRYNRYTPPFYKIPSASSATSSQSQQQLERERHPEFSYPLAAAFSFAESIQQGACGHAAVALNTASYTHLLKVCINRGALVRAMQLLDEKIVPMNDHQQQQPSASLSSPSPQMTPQEQRRQGRIQLQAFNLLLAGLARVGDVAMAQQYYAKLLATGLEPDPFTVRAVVDGLLNLGDISSAVTVVQDFFNQHCVLPPVTTHLKLLEFALATDQVYEAKRYVYFLQQLWYWQPVPLYHSPALIEYMRTNIQTNPQLQRPALQQLFQYFDQELTDKDFL